MQSLVKLIMNSLYGVQVQTDSDESHKCKSENWMQTEYGCNVLDHWRLPNGKYFVKF